MKVSKTPGRADKQYARLRSLVTHSPYTWGMLNRYSHEFEKPVATLCADIIKAALRGDLVTKDGSNFFESQQDSKAA